MNIKTYFQSFHGVMAENRIWRTLALGLCAANLIMIFALLGQKETVVLVPPTLNSEARIADNSADAPMKEAWALYIVMQLANVTPRTADYIGTQIGKSIAPAAYAGFMASIADQARRIKDENITVQFSPTHTFFVPEKDTVVVSGERTIRGVRGGEERSVRTYELGMSVSSFRVLAQSITAYEGPWKPLREEQEREAELKRIREQRSAPAATSAAGF
jgi:conjugal transfer pilus assembly protein TraE